MRTIFLSTALFAVATLAHAQSPAGKLPSQAELPATPSTSSTPNAGGDEVSARRKLDDSGYRDLRNVTPNGDGTFSAQGMRASPPGIRSRNQPEVKVNIDGSGNVREHGRRQTAWTNRRRQRSVAVHGEDPMIGKLGAAALPFLTATVALAQASVPVSTVQYSCAQGKSLTAEYYDGPTRTAADGRPIPGGRVVLTLGDGKKLTLPQTLSGSGIRYANEATVRVRAGRRPSSRGPKQTVTTTSAWGRGVSADPD